MVLPFKRDRRSLSSDRTSQKACAFEDGAVRKDTAVHVSLSSIQFSNSPEPKRHIHPVIPSLELANPPDDDSQPTDLPAANSLISMRSFQRRKRAPVPTAMAAPRQLLGLYARPSALVNARVNKLSQHRPAAVISPGRADFPARRRT
jgi:hypothetical protein